MNKKIISILLIIIMVFFLMPTKIFAETNSLNDTVQNVGKYRLTTRKYTAQIKAGNYIAGIDLPEGTYSFTVIKGNELIMSSETSSTYEVGTNSDAEWGSEISNIFVSKNSVVTVEGDLNLLIISVDASTDPLNTRTEDSTNSFTLKSGDYTFDTDFKDGTYSIYASEGSGYINSDNATAFLNCGIAVWMDISNTYDYCSQYSNVELPYNTTLHIDEGLEILMVPVY
jgi:hypothetical protein